MELNEVAKMWQRLTGAKTAYKGWQQIGKIYNSKCKKIYDEDIFKL